METVKSKRRKFVQLGVDEWKIKKNKFHTNGKKNFWINDNNFKK